MRYARQQLKLTIDNYQLSIVNFLPLLLLLLLPLTASAAQPPPANYWQYAAAARLEHIHPIDIDQDGIDELLLADKTGTMELVDANGRLLWEYTAPAPILAIATINSSDQKSHIAISTAAQLLLLAPDGEEQWRRTVASFSPPLARITGSDTLEQELWLAEQALRPIAIVPLDVAEGDERDEEILLLLESGEMQLYNRYGNNQWKYDDDSFNSSAVMPLIAVADFDGNGRFEIVRTLYNPDRRFSQMGLFNADGEPLWAQEQPLSGHITALTLPVFDDEPTIAIGSDRGELYLYDGDRQRLWLRTRDQPIHQLITVPIDNGVGLITSAAEARIAMYDRDGVLLWRNRLGEDGDASNIVRMDALTDIPPAGQPLFSVLLANDDGDLADGLLMDTNGRLLKTIPALDTTALSRLLDINHDGAAELLSARFASLALLGAGVGVNDVVLDWSYPLLSAPRSMLVIDFDSDGVDDLLTGGQDGRLHRLTATGSPRWIVEPGGAITHLLPIAQTKGEQLAVVVAHTQFTDGLSSSTNHSGIELRLANGDLKWEREFESEITAVSVRTINQHITGDGFSSNEIIIGLNDGTVMTLSPSGARLNEANIGQPVTHLLPLPSDAARPPRLIAASSDRLFDISRDGTVTELLTVDSPITGLYAIAKPGNELTMAMLLLTADGQARGLNRRGILLSQWPITLASDSALHTDAPITAQNEIDGAFLIAGEAINSVAVFNTTAVLQELDILDSTPSIAWETAVSEQATALYWGDVDGNETAEIVMGDRDGFIYLYNQEQKITTQLELSSAIFKLGSLHRGQEGAFGLTAVTENGLAQAFRAQENWPPLLTSPKTAVDGNRYTFSVSAHDAENDDIRLELEIQEPESGNWVGQGEILLNGSGDNLQWTVDTPAAGVNGVQYRFVYADPFHSGALTPPPAPAPLVVAPTPLWGRWVMAGLLLTAVGGGLMLIRWQRNSLDLRARRFYRQISQTPASTLPAFEQLYTRVDGSPDFLLKVATLARQRGDRVVTALADGLFLLANQPRNALPFLHQALSVNRTRRWLGLERWQQMVTLGNSCLTLPSITEVSLLRPRLVQLVERPFTNPLIAELLPVLTHLRDSERVDSVDDKLLYLNEAVTLLEGLRLTMPEQEMVIERPLVTAIVERWYRLATAAIEELKGRARLDIVLKTRRLAPADTVDVVIEMKNVGRAPAENIFATLDDNPAYKVVTSPQMLPLLPHGHSRLLTFRIAPQNEDRFRLGLTITYDDHNRSGKMFNFGDRVHLLPPQLTFKQIANPYSPGAPLRGNSPLFFGREELFAFIADNAGQIARRNVMILVGQRRTGKTSLLLRLEQQLPRKLIPVYIDCQSLGVTPGMPALLHELAWQISDALSLRDIDLDVAPLAEWKEDPNGRFQRHFLPHMGKALPYKSTLLLVFDEFEAFENLVNDGILPPTFFTYLRHLMQHSNHLSFIFVGTRRLEEMTSDYWSVLFNIALYRKIGYLDNKAAMRVITEPVSPHIVYDDLALDKILRVTSGHPYFLQLVCYALVKRANEQQNSYVTISDVNGALDEMMQLGEVHFAYLWHGSTTIERAILTAVSHLMESERPFQPEEIVEQLAAYGRQLNPREVTAALNHLVERDIMAETMAGATTVYTLKIGLVGLWVERTKSLAIMNNE